MKTVFYFVVNNMGLISAVCAGIVALLQWKESNNNRRAAYLDNLLNKLWEDENIQKCILMNDYGENWYSEGFHRSEDKTIPIITDKTLSFLNYICYVVKVNIIHKEESSLFDYYLSSCAQCKDMRRYLFDLYQYSVMNSKPFLFSYFLDFCIKQNRLPKGMKNKEYYTYMMLEESAKNKNTPYTLPKEIEIVKNEFKDTQLFLKTCSRCAHCTNFIDGTCKAGKNTTDYFWLPLNQHNHCSDFCFTENK